MAFTAVAERLNQVTAAVGLRRKLRVVYKDYPLLSIHPWAMRAAINANCLNAQKTAAYWDYADFVHANHELIMGPQEKRRPQSEQVLALDKAAFDQAHKHGLDARKVGADLIVAGSAIFDMEDLPRAYRRHVTGNYAGTTDEIIQWAALKWGFAPDVLRAVAVIEAAGGLVQHVAVRGRRGLPGDHLLRPLPDAERPAGHQVRGAARQRRGRERRVGPRGERLISAGQEVHG